MGYVSFELEIDSLETVNLIRNGDTSTHVFAILIEDIRQILANRSTCKISHILNEANNCTDSLAKMGALNAAHFCIL